VRIHYGLRPIYTPEAEEGAHSPEAYGVPTSFLYATKPQRGDMLVAETTAIIHIKNNKPQRGDM
jgi:hypothetical protein